MSRMTRINSGALSIVSFDLPEDLAQTERVMKREESTAFSRSKIIRPPLSPQNKDIASDHKLTVSGL